MVTKKTIQFGLKYRLYPTQEQANMLSQWVGTRRFAYNQLVAWGRIWRKENAVPAMMVDGKVVAITEIQKGNQAQINENLKEFLQKPPIGKNQYNAFARRLTALKKSAEFEWMAQVESRVFDNLMLDYKAAWSKYWNKAKKGFLQQEIATYLERKKKGKGKINANKLEYWGEPQFRIKGNRDSFSTDRSYTIDFNQRTLYFLKFKKEGVKGGLKVKIGESDRLYGFWLESRPNARVKIINERQNHLDRSAITKAIPKTITISKEPSGKFYLTISVLTDQPFPEILQAKADNCVTLDFGSGTALCYADKPIFDGSHYFKNSRQLENHLKKVKKIQKALSRKYRMNKKKNQRWKDCKTANWEKDRIRLAKLHERIANLRKARIYELVGYVMQSPYSTICYEEMNVKAMMKKEMPQYNGAGFDHNQAEIKRYFRRLLADASLSEIYRVMEYQAKWKGKKILKSPSGSPTFRECHHCGQVDNNLPVGTQEWNCQNCHRTLKKGPNSTKNIKKAAFARLTKS